MGELAYSETLDESWSDEALLPDEQRPIGLYLVPEIGLETVDVPEFEAEAALEYKVSETIQAQNPDKSQQGPLSRAEEVVLAKAVERGGKEAELAKQKLAEANQGLVVLIANEFFPFELTREDLIQQGNVGLMVAIEKFDWRKDTKFSSYAKWWIWQSIKSFIEKQGHSVYIPVQVRRNRAYLEYARDRLKQKGAEGENYTPEQLAEEACISLEEAKWALSACWEPANRLDVSEMDFYPNRRLAQWKEPDTAKSAVDAVFMEQAGTTLREAISTLPDELRRVVEMRHAVGLNISEPMTQKEIGEMIGKSETTVKKYEDKAIRKLSEIATLRAATDDPENFEPEKPATQEGDLGRNDQIWLSLPYGGSLKVSPSAYNAMLALRDGLSSSQVAKAEGIADSTVRERYQTVYKHLGVKNRSEAIERIREYMDAGYLAPEENDAE